MFGPRYETLKKDRDTLIARADLILKTAETAKRSMTDAEETDFDAAMDKVNAITPQMKHIEKNNVVVNPGGVGPRSMGRPAEVARLTSNLADKEFQFPEVGEFLRTREPGVLASLTEGGELQYVVPGYEVMQFITAYPGVDVWAQANARITDLEGGWQDGNQPIFTSGDDATVFGEGAGPTADTSAKVYVARLNAPKKHAFLSLPSEEAFEDIAALGGASTQEGIRRTIFSIGKSVTAALVSSLSSAGATVTNTGDAMEDILNLMEAGKDGIFSNPSNKFMLNRRTLSALRNTRTSGDVGIPIPLYSASANQILGFDVVRNSALPNGVVLFGDFSSAVYLRRAGLTFLLLNEAYRNVGKIGLRFTKRADWAFFSDAATASQAEQPVYMLTGGMDLGS